MKKTKTGIKIKIECLKQWRIENKLPKPKKEFNHILINEKATF